MTQHELTFSYKMEAMLSDLTTPEHRQLLVELLTIVATLMERNPEIVFVDSLNFDSLLSRAFELYRIENKLPGTTSFESFYDVDHSIAEPSKFMLRVVIEKFLTTCDLKGGEGEESEFITPKGRSDEFCPIS
jgi:phosphorylase kinase alpha/beta subunit